MSEPRLMSLGRAIPNTRYTQRELWQHRPWHDNKLFDRLFLDSPIEQRGLCVPPDYYDEARTLTETNAMWRQGALTLGRFALVDALERSQTPADRLDHLCVTTVTGYTTPGLDLLLARDLGMRTNVSRAHFNCIGCHAAVPLLKVAADHVNAHPGSRSAALAVEVCSACLRNDQDPQNLVALALFGDGAAAAVVGDVGPGPHILGFSSLYAWEHMHALGFELGSAGFRIVLDPNIPDIIASHIEAAVDGLLEQHGVAHQDVAMWCFHPGGSRILDAVQRRLSLTDTQMAASRHVLAQHGNMSSPTVMFVLAEALRSGRGAAGKYALLAAFGPGLGIELCLLGLQG